MCALVSSSVAERVSRRTESRAIGDGPTSDPVPSLPPAAPRRRHATTGWVCLRTDVVRAIRRDASGCAAPPTRDDDATRICDNSPIDTTDFSAPILDVAVGLIVLCSDKVRYKGGYATF